MGTEETAAAPPVTQTEVEHQFDDLDVDAPPEVGIVMGSKSDMAVMEKAGARLEELDIRHEMRVMSAHRDPDTVAEYARNARMRGLKVIIAGAGLDVYEDEPRMAAGLADCSNAVLLPHLGSATHATRSAMARMAAENLVAVLRGQRPPNLVNPSVLGAEQ